MDVRMNISATTVMDGKSNSFIQNISKSNLAIITNNARNLIALIFIMKVIKNKLYLNGLDTFQKLELLVFQLISI